MKKTISILSVMALMSCSDSDSLVNEICNCAAPLVELKNNEDLQELESWANWLDSDDKSFLMLGIGNHSENYDMEKHGAYRDYIKDANAINNETTSCMNGLKDKYSIGDDGIPKDSRIKLREKCPDVAKILGI